MEAMIGVGTCCFLAGMAVTMCAVVSFGNPRADQLEKELAETKSLLDASCRTRDCLMEDRDRWERLCKDANQLNTWISQKLEESRSFEWRISAVVNQASGAWKDEGVIGKVTAGDGWAVTVHRYGATQ